MSRSQLIPMSRKKRNLIYPFNVSN
jgi:hypothetical protein